MLKFQNFIKYPIKPIINSYFYVFLNLVKKILNNNSIENLLKCQKKLLITSNH